MAQEAFSNVFQLRWADARFHNAHGLKAVFVPGTERSEKTQIDELLNGAVQTGHVLDFVRGAAQEICDVVSEILA
jgi:hypothetical protein